MPLHELLDRERTVAPPGFNRWLIPPAALAVHLCIGEIYGFSVFNVPLTRVVGITRLDQGPGLDHPRGRLDLFDRPDHARALRRDPRPVGRTRRPEEDHRRQRLLLLRGPVAVQPGRLAPQHLVALPRLRRHRGHRPGPRLHRAGLDARQMVPRPAGHGDRPGHHGLRRRRPDRRPARRRADGLLQVGHLGRGEGSVPGDGRRLLRLHDVRRVHLPRARARVATGGIRPPRDAEATRHAGGRLRGPRLEDAAVLAPVGWCSA